MTKTRRTLLLLIAVGTLPIIASYALYAWWRPASHMNHGELLETRSAGLQGLKTDDGRTLAEAVAKKWVLLTVQPASCDTRCQNKLYLMRQIRTAQNENMLRLERVWIVPGLEQPDPQLLAVLPGLHLVHAPEQGMLQSLPLRADPGAAIFLIDPLGNLVLRYDDHSEPKGMLADLRRLLRYSGLG